MTSTRRIYGAYQLHRQDYSTPCSISLLKDIHCHVNTSYPLLKDIQQQLAKKDTLLIIANMNKLGDIGKHVTSDPPESNTATTNTNKIKKTDKNMDVSSLKLKHSHNYEHQKLTRTQTD